MATVKTKRLKGIQREREIKTFLEQAAFWHEVKVV